MANTNSTMLYIDASRYSNTGKKTGVENYSYHLINELVKAFRDKITLLSPRKIELDVKQIIIPFPRLWTLVRLSWEIWRNRKIDNIFVPSHVLPLIHPKNCTITIHDVVFKYSPESYSTFSGLYLNWATKFAVRHAKKIITPSEATKRDLIKFYRADPKRIKTIPLGFTPFKTDLGNAEEVLNKHALKSKKYFIFIGRIEYKKNTDTLIKAFQEFAKSDDEVKLALAGFPGHGGKNIISGIPAYLKNRVVLTGYVNEPEKAALLKNALCFVFPSRFEGFGIPLLEAMNTGVPIIASDIPSSRELAGGSALFFEKEDASALAGIMKKITENPDLCKDLIITYPDKLEKYSWEKCAKEVYTLMTG
ncbi:MAG: glycosyltransferase family 1 protein [Patescibacteria group bacterium]